MSMSEEISIEKTKNSKPRMANLELLRCVAMMMVVVLHFLGKGDLLGDLTLKKVSTAGYAAWILEAFCIVAVNVYMLISGYFLCTSNFKLSRLISLYLQVWVYSVTVGLLAAGFGIYPAEEFSIHYLLTLGFPVIMGHYWFMTAYVFLYLLLPLVGMAARSMSRQQMKVVLCLLLFIFCLLKSILPARLEMDGQGYDVLWYLCVFMTAAYIRRFGIRFLQRRGMAVALYLVGCAAVYGELMFLRRLYLDTGSMGLILKVSVEYNHILPFLASVGLFGAFLRLRIPDGNEEPVMFTVARRIAPYTLGVYLLHENIGVRYQWQLWFGADKIRSVEQLLPQTLLVVVIVFTVGVLVDMVRAALMRGLHRGMLHLRFYRFVVKKVNGVDELFRGN